MGIEIYHRCLSLRYRIHAIQMTASEITIEIIRILGQVGIFGIAVYWIQKLVDNSASKRLEEYKASLSLLESKETGLHSKRLEIIESLYSRLVELNSSMSTLTNPVKFSPTDYQKYEAELVSKANETFQSYHTFFEKNKIYFSESTCKLIHEIRDAFYQALWDYNQHKLFEAHGINDRKLISEAYQNLEKSYKSVKDEIPKLRANLENEFRRILAVQ
jgi:hypothetical protein